MQKRNDNFRHFTGSPWKPSQRDMFSTNFKTSCEMTDELNIFVLLKYVAKSNTPVQGMSNEIRN